MAIDKAVDSGKLNSDLKIVADAIRARTGNSDGLSFPEGFKSAVNSISGTKPEQTKLVSITQNGDTVINPDFGKVLSSVVARVNVPTGGGVSPPVIKPLTVTRNGLYTPEPGTDAFSPVTVDVPSDMKPEQSKNVTYRQNGEYYVTPDLGNVLNRVHISVNVPSNIKQEQEKTINVTDNGTFNIVPDSGKVLSKAVVNVNVPKRKLEQEKSVTYNRNGEYDIAPDENNVMSGVHVSVVVPSDKKPEQAKTIEITANGDVKVTPDPGKTLSSVIAKVNVLGSGGGSGRFSTIQATEWTPEQNMKTYRLPSKNVKYCIISDRNVSNRATSAVLSLTLIDAEFFVGYRPMLILSTDFQGNLTQSINYYGLASGDNIISANEYFKAGRTYDVIYAL